WRRAGGGIEMDFPLEIASPSEPPPALLIGLGAEPVWVGRNRLDYVVEVASEDVLRSLKPDLNTLAPIETRGIVVTARAAAPRLSRYDYVLRFFGPRVGIPEDMVTGTAHCALARPSRSCAGNSLPESFAIHAGIVTELTFGGSTRTGLCRPRCIPAMQSTIRRSRAAAAWPLAARSPSPIRI